MFNNNQLSLLLNIVETVERSIRSKGDPGKIQNIRAYIHRYNNNQSLNHLLLEIEEAEEEYADKMKDIKERIMREINL
jgi:hypothetical protein|tara:strand:+ start:271 stop:504 length:234 start_codon:yes stop_codon:yes gene_type:complete